jgi:sulfide:quinone oxidoreductase
MPMLDALGIELTLCAQPREVLTRGLRLEGGELVAADHVVTLAEIVARPVAGLPVDRAGFVPVDLHGRVAGEGAVYAAGEVTSYPLRQGGVATQQADAVAEAIAAACAGGGDPAPFRPVLRGRLMTSGAPLYLQARPSGQSLASTRALWSPPEKIAGRYLAPYLSTARPARIGASRSSSSCRPLPARPETSTTPSRLRSRSPKPRRAAAIPAGRCRRSRLRTRSIRTRPAQAASGSPRAWA